MRWASSFRVVSPRDDERQDTTPSLKQKNQNTEREGLNDLSNDLMPRTRKNSSFDRTSKMRKDASFDLTSMALRQASTSEVSSVDYFGIPSTVVLGSMSDDTFSEVSLESCKVLHKKPIRSHRALIVVPHHDEEIVPIVDDATTEWPSDEESTMKTTKKDEKKPQKIPMAEQAAAYFAGVETCRCDFSRPFRNRMAKDKLSRRRKKHSALQNLCGVASRDDKEDGTSRERALGSTCSSFEDERDTTPLIPSRRGPPYRLV